jgi:hypothetical protein
MDVVDARLLWTVLSMCRVMTYKFEFTAWSTSLFPNKKVGSYLCPIERSVRESERLSIGDVFEITTSQA